MATIDHSSLLDLTVNPTEARLQATRQLLGQDSPIMIPVLPDSIAGIGLPDLGPTDMMMVCGPVGHGKTTYTRAIVKKGLRVLSERNESGVDSVSRYAFLMSTEETAATAIYGFGDATVLRPGAVKDLTRKDISRAFSEIEGLPLIVTHPSATVEDAAEIIDAIASVSGAQPGLFAVDYLQMLPVRDARGTEVEKVNTAIEKVLALTQALWCPSIIAAQALLSCLSNGDPFPDMAHAMWSRRIAELSTIFLGLLNPRELRDPIRMRQTTLSNGQVVFNEPDTLLLKARKVRHSDRAKSIIWLGVTRPGLEMRTHPIIEGTPTYFDHAAMLEVMADQAVDYGDEAIEF